MAPRKPRGKKKLAWHQTINWRRWGWLAFKLGLVQDGVWNPEWQRQFASQPNYRGEVVFLLNSR